MRADTTLLANAEIDEMADRLLDALLARDPLAATRLGDSRWNAQLPDLGDTGRADAESGYRSILHAASTVPAALLTPERALTRESLILITTDLLAGMASRDYQFGVNHIRGVQSIPTAIAHYHVALQRDDLDAMLERPVGFPRLVRDHVATLRDGIEDGRTSAIEPVLAAISQIDRLLEQPTADSAVVTLATVANDHDRERVRAAVERYVQPALRAYREFLADEYRQRARPRSSTTAMWRAGRCTPNGWRMRWAFTSRRRSGSGCWKRSFFARCASSLTRACMRWDGVAREPLEYCMRPTTSSTHSLFRNRKSTGTPSGPHRRWATSSANARLSARGMT